MIMISVTILTKNSANYLEKVLAALVSFDEVLIYDTGSTDNTLLIAKQFPNVTIKEGILRDSDLPIIKLLLLRNMIGFFPSTVMKLSHLNYNRKF